MEIRLFCLLICVWFSSCHKPDLEVLQEKHEESEFISSRNFSELYQEAKAAMLEAKAVMKVRDYLLAKGMDIDSLYVYEIDYSDSCEVFGETRFVSDPINACVAVFNIEHQVNHDYNLEIRTKNARIIEDYEKENGDSVPLLIPSKPDFLRKQILLYYYFEGDSIVEVLSQ